jgi:hypothetical protein
MIARNAFGRPGSSWRRIWTNGSPPPPGPYLQKLIYDLLKISDPSQEEVSLHASKEQAAYILAQAPDLGSELIAGLVNVDRTSIDRWKKDQKFQARVSALREFMTSPKWKSFSQKKERFRWIEVPQ